MAGAGPPMFKPGSQIGRYRVVGALGRGNPDGLYEVHDEAGRRFALRAPLADLEEGDPAVTARFGPEAEALRSLAQRNLVALFDVLVHAGHLCLVMERVRGRPLGVAIAAGRLGPRAALIIARQLLDALAHAHTAGLVHRDLRPSKVMLVAMTGWDLVKLTDVGLGMLRDEALLEFGAGAFTGSVPRGAAAYLAPEQVRGRSVDARTDLYALGAIVFEMLAGRPPFPDPDPELVRSMQLSVPPPRLDELCGGAAWCTREVRAVVERALAKERDDRFASAAQMIEAVDAAWRSIAHLPG